MQQQNGMRGKSVNGVQDRDDKGKEKFATKGGREQDL